MHSKLLALFAFATAVAAQTFPTGEFFISNSEFQQVLAVEGGSSEPHTPIVLSEFDHEDEAQIWTYAQGRGFLKNKKSGLVLEVPRNDGRVDYGTILQQAVKRGENDDDLIQLWDYDEQLEHVFSLADTSACISGNSTYAVVDFCDAGGNSPSEKWSLVSTEDMQKL